MNNFEIYENQVLTEIKSRINPKLLAYTTDDQGLLDMISEHRNEYGEYDLQFPGFISQSVGDAYQDNVPVTEYVDQVIEGIIILLEGSASVM